MVELVVHRFTDCERFPREESAAVQHRLSSLDLRKVTCSCCKRRIVDEVVNRHWAKLGSLELAALEIAAAEVAADAEDRAAVK